MDQFDYIIVGLGIAGVCLSEQLASNNKSFIVIDSGREGATLNSGGVLNPTVLKRFNVAWNASEFYDYAFPFYHNISNKLGIEVIEATPILRIFKTVEEQNNWSVASDKNELRRFLSSEFIPNRNSQINAPLGFGKVVGTAKIHTSDFINGYREYLRDKGRIVTADFNYGELIIRDKSIRYKDISTKVVVFCEGSLVKNNPFFLSAGIVPNKGEYITIKAPELKLDLFLKGPLYIIPLGGDIYKVGGTFDRADDSDEPTWKAREDIIGKLNSMINCRYEILSQSSGVRATTKDRKPLLGTLDGSRRIYFFNGLGSRGFTMAPLLSKMLYEHMELGNNLTPEIDIKRILEG